MSARRVAALLLALAFILPAAAQRRNRTITNTELIVRLVLPSERTVHAPLRVQLLTGGGVPVRDMFARDGQVRFEAVTGSYRVTVSGDGFETTTSDVFQITSNEAIHHETVVVKPKASAGAGSKEATISAAGLNVPDKARKEFEKGNAAMMKKDYPSAISHYRSAVQTYPRYAAAYNNLGLAYFNSNDAWHAREAFQNALEADDRFARGYANLARIRLLEKDANAAIQLLQRSLSVDPTNVDALALLANSCYVAGRLDDAVVAAQRAHALPHADYAVVHLIAGRALESQQKFNAAASEYRQFLEEAGSKPGANQAKAGLARVEAAQANATRAQR